MQPDSASAPRLDQAPALLPTLAISLAVLALWRFAVLATNGLDLSFDEAQYAVWARDPAFGYYSKPPLIACAIAALGAVCGPGEACVRATATLFQTGAALLVGLTGARLFGTRTGLAAGIVYATLPMVSFSSLFVTTDAPLAFFIAAALWFAVRVLEAGRLGDWALFGASIGFALMSKYSAGVFVLAWLVFLALSSERRRLFFAPGHFLAGAIAAGIFLPNILWNAAHDFPTLRHTAEISSLAAPRFGLKELGLFVGSQILIFGPVLAIAAAIALFRMPSVLREERYRLPAVLALVPLALFAALAFASRANANWAAFAFVPGAVLAAALLLRANWRRTLVVGVLLNLVLGVGFSHLPHIARGLDLDLRGKANPMRRVTGWAELGREVSARLADAPGFILAGDERIAMAGLLYYVRPVQSEFAMWNPNGGITDHFRLTNDADRYVGRDFLFVKRGEDQTDFEGRFQKIVKERPIRVDMGDPEPETFQVYRLIGFRGYGERAK